MEAEVVELRARLPLEVHGRVGGQGLERQKLHRGGRQDIVGTNVPGNLANSSIDVRGDG